MIADLVAALIVSLAALASGTVSGSTESDLDPARVFDCIAWAAQAHEHETYDALALLAKSLPARDQFAIEAPDFADQNDDFWRGFMIGTFIMNSARFSKEEAKVIFDERQCAALADR
jgi:hypothetical protein